MSKKSINFAASKRGKADNSSSAPSTMTHTIMNKVIINSIADLLVAFAAIKKGRFATLYAEKPIGLYKNVDGARGKSATPVSADFCPMDTFHVTFHFGEDYENAMKKVMGDDFTKSSNDNIETLISGVLMRYKSTNNVCVIFMKGNRTYDGVTLNGQPLTDAEKAYLERCKKPTPKGGNNPLEYRTISLNNVTKIVSGHTEYIIALNVPNVSAAI